MGAYNERFQYIADESHFERHGSAVAWLGNNLRPCGLVSDRLQTQYLRRSPIDGNLYADDVLSVSGIQVLSLRDAVALGFNTSEYQAGLRMQMLQSYLVQDEDELVAECRPPSGFAEADRREQGLDSLEDWLSQSEEQQVPYPDEIALSGFRAIGWASVDGRLLKSTPFDRFQNKWLVRNMVTGQLHHNPRTLAQSGLESLSIADALKLGFSTVEYRTALRVRLFERRYLKSETDLLESIHPPVDVEDAFQYWGRIPFEEEDRRLTRDLYGPSGFDFRYKEEAARLWLDRYRTIDTGPFMHP
ncbi:hypothetical protein GGE45_002579 [Rhizobium aethiopicum]|uniref:Uncharacterized protein n=1 Tax=Rhizobium aethiopicum TaxID=1138170 RepID=A0A7W6MCQ1_9HYPH|nr:hypothetical protein [Rhizobium aethiopicum]MBB4190012.1 hypothetical protein [Rhizobium aethiopicum]MBB4580249.1 hypothetical protein [Rhizobium aethiopicum]